jgi:hypothetical protein
MLQAMGYSGPIHIYTALSSIVGIPWLYAASRWFMSGRSFGSELDDDLDFSISTTKEDLCEKPDGVAMEVLRYVLFSVNASDLVDTQEKLENQVRMGYEFNLWPKPDKLRT